jgi:hypothetical protein
MEKNRKYFFGRDCFGASVDKDLKFFFSDRASMHDRTELNQSGIE